MWFVVTGARQGQTFKGGSLHSPLHFKDGMIEVPDDAKDMQNLLSNFYEAHPAHECSQQEDGKIVWNGAGSDGSIKPSFKLPVAVKELTEGAEGGPEGSGTPPAEPPVFEKPKPKK